MNKRTENHSTGVSPREQVLRKIRGALAGRSDASGQATTQDNQRQGVPAEVTEHLRQRRRHTQPSPPGNIDLTLQLLQQMEQVQITVTRLQTRREVPEAVREYCREHAIEGDLVVSPAIETLEWPDSTVVGTARDALQTNVTLTSVTPCLCAVAETGSVVTLSDKQTPVTLNYLPDNHVVVLHESQIVAHLEDAWTHQRAAGKGLSALASAASEQNPGDPRATSESVPRALNFLTGPSRTADIEQTLELGAHGPRRMHVLLVAESFEDAEGTVDIGVQS